MRSIHTSFQTAGCQTRTIPHQCLQSPRPELIIHWNFINYTIPDFSENCPIILTKPTNYSSKKPFIPKRNVTHLPVKTDITIITCTSACCIVTSMRLLCSLEVMNVGVHQQEFRSRENMRSDAADDGWTCLSVTESDGSSIASTVQGDHVRKTSSTKVN